MHTAAVGPSSSGLARTRRNKITAQGLLSHNCEIIMIKIGHLCRFRNYYIHSFIGKLLPRKILFWGTALKMHKSLELVFKKLGKDETKGPEILGHSPLEEWGAES